MSSRRACHDPLQSAWAWLVGLSAIVASATLPAQTPPVPAGVEPGAAQRQLQSLPEPAPPRPAPAAPRLAEQAPADAARILLKVQRVDLAGPGRYFTEPVPGIHALNGQEVPLTAIYALAQQLTAHFRNEGYLLTSVRVPPQTISDGVVRLEVLEGFLSDVLLTGSKVRPGLFEGARRALLAERPLRAESLERFLLLFNDLPGLTARGTLRASPDQPGASELIVQVTQPRLSLQLGGSNRGSRYQGPNQYRAAATLNSALGLSESTSLQYMQAQSSKEMRLLSLSHAARLTAGGVDLNLSGSTSKGAPDIEAILGGFPLETESRQVRAELGIPLVRRRTSNLRARMVASWHDGESELGGMRQSADTISALRIGATWDTSDRHLGVNIFDLELSKGFRVLGASESNAPDASRPGGDPRFSKATLYAARLQALGRSAFSALFAVNGQYAFDNLLSPEEFAFGGEQFGRAYDSSELVGDTGWAGKIELRHTSQMGNALGMTLYAFGEHGSVHRRLDPIEVGVPRTDSATSIGGGVRFTLLDRFTGYVEGARPTDHAVGTYRKRKTRVFGGLQVNYPLQGAR